MVVEMLTVIGVVELVSHILGYSSSATIVLVRTALIKLHEAVEAVLTKK